MSAAWIKMPRSFLRTTFLLSAGLLAFAMLTLACSSPPYMQARIGTPAGVVSPSVEHGEGLFQGTGGIKLYEQFWRPKQPARAALVIVHGLKDHGSRYAALAERLVDQGYAVYAADLRGHAHSEGIRVYTDSFDEYLSDLDIFLKRVREREPKKPVFLFGHSMGGAIVTRYTIERKPDLKGLILSGAALMAPSGSGAKAFGAGIASAIAPKSLVFNPDLNDFSRDPKGVLEAQNDPLVYQDGVPARTVRGLFNTITLIQERMEEVKVPVLILHGAADKVTPPEGSKDLEKRAGAADKKIVLYAGLYHDILHEPEREKVMTDITQWLNAHTDAPAPVESKPAAQ